MCRLHSALAATACQNSSTSSLSNSPIFGAGNSRCADAKYGPAAQVDGAGHERLVHRQREVAVAADARLVAEACSSAWPRQMPTSSTVWC